MSKQQQALLPDPHSPAEALPAPATRREDILRPLTDHWVSFQTFLRRRVANEAVAEDLLQQSLMRALERHHSLKQDHSVVAWFYSILRHTVIDYYRSQAAETRRNDAFLQELTIAGDNQVPPPDEIKTTICSCLNRLLPSLRPGYADLLRRIDLDGEPLPRVAQDLKITLNNATVRLHRARQALRVSLEQACGVCSKHGCLNCTCE